MTENEKERARIARLIKKGELPRYMLARNTAGDLEREEASFARFSSKKQRAGKLTMRLVSTLDYLAPKERK